MPRFDPPQTLADFTSPALMLPTLRSRSISGVMRELHQVLQGEEGSLPDLVPPGVAALNCELLTGTALDLGAAFPRLSVPVLSRSRFALGRAVEPLTWRAPGFHPTDLLFFILEPPKAGPEGGRLVNTLQELGKNSTCLDNLRRATTAEAMFATLAQIALTPADQLPTRPVISAAPSHRPASAPIAQWRWRR